MNNCHNGTKSGAKNVVDYLFIHIVHYVMGIGYSPRQTKAVVRASSVALALHCSDR